MPLEILTLFNFLILAAPRDEHALLWLEVVMLVVSTSNFNSLHLRLLALSGEQKSAEEAIINLVNNTR